MVLERRLYYGFTGNQVPVVPRASRSPRGRRPFGRKCEANKIHAFEILASVAGDLLQDDFSVPSSICKNAQINIASNNAKQDQVGDGKFLTEESSEEGEICEKKLDSVPMLQGHRRSCSLDGFLHAQESTSFRGSEALQKFDHSGKMHIGDNMDAYRRSPSEENQGDLTYAEKCWEDGVGSVIEEKTEDGLSSKIKTIGSNIINVKGSLVGAEELDTRQPLSISSQSNTKESLFMDFMALATFSGKRVDVNPVTVDDDDNSIGYSQGGITVKDYRPSPHIRDRRIRKVSASRYYKVPPNKKGGGYCRTDGKAKPNYCSGRASYVHQGSQKIFPFKKRKFFDQCEFYCEDVTSPDRRSNDENCRHTKMHASGESSSLAGQHQSMDCNVKLSIKSFKVPELFVEVPATTTVGSLKRRVLEAVSAILGDGLHVGILLQGKKVRDDSKTLFQTGISQDDKRRSLGFMLEPTCSQVAPPSGTEDHPFLSGRAAKRLSRHASSLTTQPGNSGCYLVPPDVNFHSHTASEFGVNASVDDSASDSKALVAVPAVSMEALAVVPYNRKSGNNEFVQRRIRRPFSVSEVEALVQAVEKLGTGRWRDVKLRAFDNANHRTYVDLKDKWKTLVHTARISPQQRRGEPVPQGLLDRVLAAHAFWSQQQVKQHAKAAV